MNETIPDKEAYQTNRRRMCWAALGIPKGVPSLYSGRIFLGQGLEEVSHLASTVQPSRLQRPLTCL